MRHRPQQSPFSKLVATCITGWLLSTQASALDFRSTAEHGTTFVDAPNAAARKLFLTSRGYPVEVLSENKDWLRVRDVSGTLAWVEKKALVNKRTILVTAAKAEVRAAAEAKAALVFVAEKQVTLDLVETGQTGWAKVRHRDGKTGFIRIQDAWGL